MARKEGRTARRTPLMSLRFPQKILAEELVHDLLPLWPCLGPSPPGVELLGGLPALSAADEVDLHQLVRAGALPDDTDDVETHQDGDGD